MKNLTEGQRNERLAAAFVAACELAISLHELSYTGYAVAAARDLYAKCRTFELEDGISAIARFEELFGWG